QVPSITSAFWSNASTLALAIVGPASLPYSAMPAGSFTSSVMTMYALAIHTPLESVDFPDRTFRAVLDRLARRGFQLRRHLFEFCDRPTVVGQFEHLGAQGEAHAVPGAAILVDRDLHRAPPETPSNSRCNSVRPRRM